jgi:GH25 family lysozyme M1 (1,4-beta-N-acetylmuramidase)
MHIGRRVFIRKEGRTYLNSHVPRIPFFLASVSTPTLKSSRKSTTHMEASVHFFRNQGMIGGIKDDIDHGTPT